MTKHVREDLGALLLGALEPADAERVRAHLAVCPRCHDEHEQLAALPELLDLLAADAPAALAAPPDGMEEAVLSALRSERGRSARSRARLWRGRPLVALAGALAGAAATVAVLAAGGVLGGAAGDLRTVALSAPGSGASAKAVLRPVAAGTRVRLELRGLRAAGPGEVYELWFVNERGRVSAGTFTVPDDGRARVWLTTAARPGGYRRIGITREPDGIDPARNGPNVLAGRLSS